MTTGNANTRIPVSIVIEAINWPNGVIGTISPYLWKHRDKEFIGVSHGVDSTISFTVRKIFPAAISSVVQIRTCNFLSAVNQLFDALVRRCLLWCSTALVAMQCWNGINKHGFCPLGSNCTTECVRLWAGTSQCACFWCDVFVRTREKCECVNWNRIYWCYVCRMLCEHLLMSWVLGCAVEHRSDVRDWGVTYWCWSALWLRWCGSCGSCVGVSICTVGTGMNLRVDVLVLVPWCYLDMACLSWWTRGSELKRLGSFSFGETRKISAGIFCGPSSGPSVTAIANWSVKCHPSSSDQSSSH
jgi:hypothetical protein